MKIQGRKVMVLGGPGLVGMAVCREMLERQPAELHIHALSDEEVAAARAELASEAGDTPIRVSSGDIFGPAEPVSKRRAIAAQLETLRDENLPDFLLYRLLTERRPEILIDCVNTATAIAYRDVYPAAEELVAGLDELAAHRDAAERLLEALYVPRLIRHIQVLYRGMIEAGTAVYLKVGTSGTGGMGLNVPYTHSEEKPSRMLLSKSAVAGAHSLLLFLMARTPDAPFTKEIKPAAAIAWRRIERGPIHRKGVAVELVHGEPRPLGETFSTEEPGAAEPTGRVLETAFIDTGENGIFSLEEFALLTTALQMEFVTPEEIAQNLVLEIEGANTGHDVINALDNAVLGPTYRAGLMRHWALERMTELEAQGSTRSVAFEMLGPPRNSKLLFEAHLLREAFGTMRAVRESSPEAVAEALAGLIAERPRLADEVISVGLPILLDDGRLLRGPQVIVPARAEGEPVTPERIDRWAESGWVDLRRANCGRWIERFRAIARELSAIPESETSSRYLRDRRFWREEKGIQPGKVVGWILSVQEHGSRLKH